MADQSKVTVFVSLPGLLASGDASFWHAVLNDNDVLAELSDGSDRVLAVVAGGALEADLKAMIGRCLVDDPELAGRFLGLNGPAGAFGAQVNLAYLMGLIDRRAKDDLVKVATIRNLFAHQARGLSFAASPVREHCRDLQFPDVYTRSCGDDPSRGLMVHSKHAGRVSQLGLDLGRRDERLTDPRWRFEITVQLLSFLLKQTSPARPVPATPSTSMGMRP
ncbi:hypothetical protein [Brevundimonas sp. P7753]|uniref:hypothetical protein n=1 Tax=Brevundimonas sp. P7753 TaxID=2726982 RepID=UPI0015B80BD4|nr:hypothetical protein [Brevundimonas sp. P7753]NWE53678.1 hypothetical protein [Brevundimonas sp. P7753]